MTEDQVANMFGEAQRMNSSFDYRKLMQNGIYSKADARSIVKKDTNFYLNLAMDPENWKNVT